MKREPSLVVVLLLAGEVQVLVAFGGFLWLFQLQLFQLRHRGGCCVLSMTGLVPPFTLGN
jgi:hypothetical protein